MVKKSVHDESGRLSENTGPILLLGLAMVLFLAFMAAVMTWASATARHQVPSQKEVAQVAGVLRHMT